MTRAEVLDALGIMRLARFATLASAGTALLLSSAAGASAATLCVGSDQPAGVACDQTFSFDATGLTQALTAARTAPNHAIADTIRVAAGTIAVTTALDLNGSTPDTLQGAGRDATTITSSTANLTALSVGGPSNAGGLVSDLTLASDAYTSNAATLFVRGGASAERVRVRELSPAMGSGLTTVALGRDATLRDAAIEVNSSNDDGIAMTSGPAAVSQVTISGPGAAGVRASFDPAVGTALLDHLRISGMGTGTTVDYGDLTVTDSLIDLGTRAFARGVQARNPNTSYGLIRTTLKRSTIIGSGNGQLGVIVEGDGAYNGVPEDGQAPITDSIIDLSGTNATALTCLQGATGLASLTLTSVAYRAASTSFTNCAPTETNSLDLTTHPARYRDAAAGDYRPTYDSPVVDASSTMTKVGSTTDLAGGARLVAGRGAGVALVDLGAYEYQRAAPSTPTISASATTIRPGETVTLQVGGAVDPEGETVTYAWDLGDGQTATGAAASRTFAAPGTYVVSAAATDAAGAASTPATATITVSAPVQAAVTPSLTLTKAPTGKGKRGKMGFTTGKPSKTTATLSLTNVASLKLSLASVRGKKTKAFPGTATLPVSGTTVNLAFGGTFAGKRLKAGTYKVTVTPLSATGAAGTPASYTLRLK